MDKKDLRIVYMGTPDFAVASLKALVEGGYNIVGVITMPDKPIGRHGSKPGQTICRIRRTAPSATRKTKRRAIFSIFAGMGSRLANCRRFPNASRGRLEHAQVRHI